MGQAPWPEEPKNMQVTAFYDAHPISEAQILRALHRAGHDPDRLGPEDLYAHDQDHYGGVEALRFFTEAKNICIRIGNTP